MKRVIFAALTASVLTGCNDNNQDAATPNSTTTPKPLSTLTLNGTAAVGSPIVDGTINTKCASGDAIPPVKTNSTGAYAVTATGQTLPCAVRVTGGTVSGVANTAAYQSLATSAGTVNITPLTNLVMANLTGSNLDTWFDSVNSNVLTAMTAASVNNALANLRTALALPAFNSISPITTAFSPVSGNVSDDILSAFSAAMTTAMLNYNALLTAAIGTTAGAPFVTPTGFNTALATAYANTISGVGTAPNTGGLSITSASTFGGVLAAGNPLYIIGANLGAVGDPITVTFTGGASATTTVTPSSLILTIPVGVQSGTFTVTNTRTNATATSTFSLEFLTVTSKCKSFTGVSTTLPSSATTWSDCSESSPTGKIEWLGNRFVVSGTNKGVQVSVDGYMWTDVAAVGRGGAPVEHIAFNGVRWVGVKTGSSNLSLTFSANTEPSAWTVIEGISLSYPGSFTNVFAANGRFFIATNNGSFLTSTDGMTWAETANGLCGGASSSPVYAGNTQGVSWSGSKYQFNVQATSFVAPATCSSTDGITWVSEVGSPPSNVYAWDGKKYVASTLNGILTSADKINWLKSTIAAPVLTYIIWTGTQFIGLEQEVQSGQTMLTQRVHTSTDGLNWSVSTLTPPVGAILASGSLAYSPTHKRAVVMGRFSSQTTSFPYPNASFVLHHEPNAAEVVIKPAPTAVTADVDTGGHVVSLSWTGTTGAAAYNVYRSTSAGQAVTAMTKIASAQTATTFTDTGLTGSTTYYYKVEAVIDAVTTTVASAESSVSTPLSWRSNFAGVSRVHFTGVASSGSQFVAIGGVGNLFASDGNSTWTQHGAIAGTLNSVIWTGNQFVVVNDVGGIQTSPDGLAWAAQTSGTTQYLSGIASSGSKIVVVGDKGVILSSTDGVTWTARTSGITGYISAVTWSGSQFVAVSGTTILTSSDGVTWTTHASTGASTNGVNSIIHAGSQFVAVGSGGSILTSPDGLAWTSRVINTTNVLKSVTWSGSLFVAVGNGGIIRTSTDGVVWAVSEAGSTKDFAGVAWSGSQFVVVGYGGNTILSSP